MSLIRPVTRSVMRPVMRGVMGRSGLFENPLVSLVGPSTTQENNAYLTGIVYDKVNGPDAVARFLNNQSWQCPVYRDAGDARGYSGYNFAVDGATIALQATQFTAALATSSMILIMNSGRGSGDVDPGVTLSDYCDPVKARLLAWKASIPGRIAIWRSLVLRNSSLGGDWGPGGYSRGLCLAINAEMASWCPTNGVLILDDYAVTLDGSSPDQNPLSGVLASDLIHYAPKGAWLMGSNQAALMATIVKEASIYNPYAAGNIHPNPGFTGQGSAANFANGATWGGSTSFPPTGMTLSRSGAGNARGCAGSIEVIDGQNWVVMTGSGAGAVAAAGEGYTLRYDATYLPSVLTVGLWYQGRAMVDVSAWDGYCGVKLYMTDQAGTPQGSQSLCNMVGANGNDPVNGFTSTGQYYWTTGAARVGMLKTPPFQATNVNGRLGLLVAYRDLAGNGVVKTGLWDFREVADPTI